MSRRGVYADEVQVVADTGDVILSYPDDTPYPSELILGWIDSRPLHVLLAYNVLEGSHTVITAYEPDPNLWGPDFRRKR